jgi:hypothetical protein
VGTEELVHVARVFLIEQVNIRVGHGDARVAVGDGPGRPGVLWYSPDSLLSAMYLQFGAAVAGNKEHRSCKQCGRWFELVPQDRGRTVFGSDKCKVQEYRGRQQRAAEMRASGRPPKEIATAIETDLATVKRWLRKGKGA